MTEFESYIMQGMRGGPKIATSTCVHCHSIMPRTEMKQVAISENVGSSFRTTPRGNGKVSYSTSSFTRRKKVWVCKGCVGSYKSERFFSSGWLKVLAVLGALYYYIMYVAK